MREIEYEGKKLLYEVYDFGCDYSYYNFDMKERVYVTVFYDSEPVITKYKKYYLFGKIVEKVRYKKLFSIDIDITDPKYSKKDIRKLIVEQFDLIKERRKREKEIEKGEII